MKRKIAVTISVFLFCITLFSFVKGSPFYWKNESHVVKGVLNLENWNGEQQKVISLNGEWEFYPNELLAPDTFQDEKQQKQFIQVPNNWDKYFSGKNIETGTYRIKVQLPEDGMYGLKVNSIRHASKVFINGNVAGGIGIPSSDIRKYEYREGKYLALGNSENRNIEIVIHCANVNLPNGGIVKPILFGKTDDIIKVSNQSILFDGFIVGGYFLLAIVYFLHYILGRKQLNELYFALFSLFQSVYVSTQNEKIIYLFFPEIPNPLLLSIQLSFIHLSALFFLLFVHDLFREAENQIITKCLVMLISVQAILFGIPNLVHSITYPMIPIQYIQIYLVFISGITYVYLFIILIRAFFKYKEGAGLILIAVTAFTCYGLSLGLELLLEIDVSQIPLLLYLLMSVCLSFFIAFRRQLAYERIDYLAQELLVQGQLKNQFIINIAQELKGPMDSILDSSKRLMEGREGPLKRKQQELVIFIHELGKKLDCLAYDLRNVSSNRTKLKLNLQPVDVKILYNMVDELSFLIKNPDDLFIENNIPLDLPNVLAEENSLKQIVYNLIHNAIKFTRSGKITVSADVKGNMMHISVEDTGIGVEEKYLEQIFETFYQVPYANNERLGGLGIGLSITKHLVELMGGEISVTSKPKKGTCFTITLPLQTGELQGSAKETYSHPAAAIEMSEELMPERVLSQGQRDPQILLVGEDDQQLVSMSTFLSGQGYYIMTCTNSEDALNLLKKKEIDLTIIDLMMSHNSGYELIKNIRAEHHLVELPILILTASGQFSNRFHFFQIGANDVMQKPIIHGEFISRIQSLLAMKDAVQQSVHNELNYYYAQITPHFLFNTLNTIIGLSYKDTEKTREALEHLAVYFRAKLDFQKHHSVVWLDEEIELVQSYLEIEKLRFGERLIIEYDIDENINVLIPAMTIQPLVENAVLHGLSSMKESGILKLSIGEEDRFIKITIEDNGAGIPENKQSQLLHGQNQRIGFKNPVEKLKLIKHSSFHLWSEVGKGTKITILLPRE
ncbi:hybrid sensor histidine kinase/response regulator [Bacillus benzoevorans]|uniref:histidine kinase n=1 Tax=Bacillus benzoevorans TaxID=1456 RepID=A0A7X0HNC7_9BACI|nr:ATP-binding protein [Bacillus benzoevorans]MBB6443963.1 sensor histidine kinase YesM [Bacillus benzoevorans]